jgi:hypothetical protein
MNVYHLTFEHAIDNIKKYGLLRDRENNFRINIKNQR